MAKAKSRSKLKAQAQQVLSQRLETPNELRFRLFNQDGWGVAVVASLGWLLMWWAYLAERGFWMGLWLLPGLGLLAWASWLVWHPVVNAVAVEVHRMTLRLQRKAVPDIVAALPLPDKLYTSTGALVNLPAHWVGRTVQASPMHLDAEVCPSERAVLRLSSSLAIEREWRWRLMGRWRAQRALALAHGVVALYLVMPLSGWMAHWHHALASVQPVTTIATPTLDQVLRQPPAVGEMVRIKAQVCCAEQRDTVPDSEVIWRTLDCKQRLWGDSPQAVTLHLSEPVEPKLEALSNERLGPRWPGVELPPQAPHEVGFFGQVTRVERAAGSTVALHIDTQALPSNAGGSRIAVISTLLAVVLAVVHASLGLLVLGARFVKR